MKGSKENENIVTTTMSKAYQITVPSVVRKALGLEPGDPVDFAIEGDGARLVKALTREERIKQGFVALDEWREGLPEDAKEKIKEHAGWTVNQYHEYFDNLPETKKYLKEKYGVKIA